MTTAPSVRRFGILIATASAILAACSPSSDGGGGPPVQQQPIETVSSAFNFTATGTFTVGDSPANATFTGGVATGGMWVIPDGQTGVISFTTPTRDLSFTVEGLDANSAAARFAKAALPGAFRKTTCGISDQGFDNTEPFGTEMFVRGGFNDWPALPSAPQNFISFGDGTLQAEFELTAGEWEFKIASAGWDVQYAPDPDAQGSLAVGGSALPMADTAPVGPNGVMIIPEDGCYNFLLNGTDTDNPTVALTQVTLDDGTNGGGGKTTCGIDDQGFDNGEPYGTEMFVRGGFNDWPALPDAPQNFISFGDGTLQAEFELTAGMWEFKIASPGWDVQYAPDPDAQGNLEVGGPALLMQDTAPVGPNGVMNIPADGCYNFVLDATDPDNPTISISEVDLSGGGGGKTTCGIDDQGFDNAEPYGTEMFVRGGFNDWPALPAAPQNFISFGDGTLQAEFELTAGMWEFKIASPGWDVQYAPDPDAQGNLEVGGPALLMQDTAPVGPNGVMNIPADGCYNFVLDATDPDNPTIQVSEVDLSGGGPPGKAECGIDDQGFDNAEPYGTEMFVRGGFNDWPALPAAPQNFISFGDGTLQAEFELTAGMWEFKIASPGWDVQYAPDPATQGTLEAGGPALTMEDTAPVGPNGQEKSL